ncbi:MAG TPA: MFS transporter [Ilumatobacter sp.]|nr:MFS transporter [Ilumatobacter sp.]
MLTDPSTLAIDRDPDYQKRLLITVVGAIAVSSTTMTIVAASLPTIADDLSSSETTLSWAVTGLILMIAVGTPVLGKLGDVHGHRRLFLAGSVILGLGSLLCAIAPTAVAFIGGRMVSGLGLAAAIPNGNALIMEAYPVEGRAQAMGWYQMAMTGAPVIGLVAGGPLIDAFGWRSVFWLIVPIAAAASVLAWKVIQPSAERTRVRIDWAGAASLAIATVTMLLFIQRGGSAGFLDQRALGFAAVSIVAATVFIRTERRAPSPMLRLDYFGRRNFTGPLIAQPLTQFAYMGSFLIAPLLLADVFGYSVTTVALVLLVRPASFSISSPLGGKLAAGQRERQMMLTGTTLMVLAMLTWVVAAHQVSLPWVFAGLLFSGLAAGLAAPSYATVLADAVDPGDLGVASGMGTTMMNIGVLLGIQSMFTVLGDGRAPTDFASVFAFGAAVAALSVVGALIVRPARTATPQGG